MSSRVKEKAEGFGFGWAADGEIENTSNPLKIDTQPQSIHRHIHIEHGVSMWKNAANLSNTNQTYPLIQNQMRRVEIKRER